MENEWHYTDLNDSDVGEWTKTANWLYFFICNAFYGTGNLHVSLGPCSLKEVASAYSAKSLNEESYLWHPEECPEWTLLKDRPDILDRIKPKPKPKPKPRPKPGKAFTSTVIRYALHLHHEME